jgi:hypothetical protein
VNDTQFRQQVAADAERAGWSPDLAEKLARLVGKPVSERKQAPRGPIGKAPRVVNHPREIAALLRVCSLPAAMQADFAAAGVCTFAAVRKMVAPVLAARDPKAAAQALRLHLFARRKTA